MQKGQWVTIALAIILSCTVCSVVAYKTGVQDVKSQALWEAQRHVGVPLKSDLTGKRVTVFTSHKAVVLQTEGEKIAVANFGPDGQYARAAAVHAMMLWNAAIGSAK